MIKIDIIYKRLEKRRYCYPFFNIMTIIHRPHGLSEKQILVIKALAQKLDYTIPLITRKLKS